MNYKGVWQESEEYQTGDSVIYGGNVWLCDWPTSDEPGTSPAWKRATKRGKG